MRRGKKAAGRTRTGRNIRTFMEGKRASCRGFLEITLPVIIRQKDEKKERERDRERGKSSDPTIGRRSASALPTHPSSLLSRPRTRRPGLEHPMPAFPAAEWPHFATAPEKTNVDDIATARRDRSCLRPRYQSRRKTRRRLRGARHRRRRRCRPPPRRCLLDLSIGCRRVGRRDRLVVSGSVPE